MPKRNVQVIAHAVLTNHRIVAEAEEPYPDAAFHLTSPQMPDLVQVDAIPDKESATPSSLVLLKAYGQLMTAYPEYRERYFALAKQLEATEPDNIDVLEGLATLAMEGKDDQAATHYLQSAIKHGTTSPQSFEQLGRLLLESRRFPDAVAVLERGVQLAPYDASLYRLLGSSYLSLQRMSQATAFLKQAVQVFPQDFVLRSLLRNAEGSSPARETPQ